MSIGSPLACWGSFYCARCISRAGSQRLQCWMWPLTQRGPTVERSFCRRQSFLCETVWKSLYSTKQPQSRPKVRTMSGKRLSRNGRSGPLRLLSCPQLLSPRRGPCTSKSSTTRPKWHMLEHWSVGSEGHGRERRPHQNESTVCGAAEMRCR
jgi:hypothetical protein